MRILYIVSGTAFGGAQQHTLQLAEFMRGKKHEIGIMVADEPRLIKEATTIGDAVFTNPHFVSSLPTPPGGSAFAEDRWGQRIVQ